MSCCGVERYEGVHVCGLVQRCSVREHGGVTLVLCARMHGCHVCYSCGTALCYECAGMVVFVCNFGIYRIIFGGCI